MPVDADSVSLFFPVYKDERTVRTVAQKAGCCSFRSAGSTRS